MESQHKSSSQCSNIFPKGFWLFPFLSMLLTIALFLRMEAINNKTEINGMRISKVESQMKIMTTLHATDDKDVGLTQDSKKMLPSSRIRRSMNSAINSSLSIEDVRREINIRISQLKPQSWCQPSKNACVPGPPGEKGSRGSRGRRGRPGDKGKKGSQGIMGPSGRHGKQGIMGSPGIKGEKGQKVSPRFTRVPGRFLVIEEDAVASVTCEAFSYPPSVITWTRPLVALPRGRISVTNGTLTIQDFSAVDTGTYVCTAKNKLGSVTAVMALNIQRKPDSCKAAVSKHSPTGGTYDLKVNSNKFQVYCDVKTQGSHWTLIARFSNRDTKNWMRDDGLWWYDQNASMGTTTDPSVNTDMISPAFWLVSGMEFKVTRSDDSSHTPLLQTTGNCLGGQTFRSKVTSYGDFRNGKVWSSNRCLGSCTVQYGGQYKTTHGFGQAECSSSSIQSSNKIGFWCDWDGGDGSVMMIGGGGNDCNRADHGIGITETNAASFVEESGTQTEYDFGYDADTRRPPTKSYSLNLWIR